MHNYAGDLVWYDDNGEPHRVWTEEDYDMGDYEMIPQYDTIMYADELTEGMRVLKDNMYSGGRKFRRVTKLRNYTTHETSGYSMMSNVVKHISFIGVADDGHQETTYASPQTTFIVKKDSITPERSEYLENSAIPGVRKWESDYAFARDYPGKGFPEARR